MWGPYIHMGATYRGTSEYPEVPPGGLCGTPLYPGVPRDTQGTPGTLGYPTLSRCFYFLLMYSAPSFAARLS